MGQNKYIKLDEKQLRQLQLTELEILKEVDQICRTYGIRYSLSFGTMLGALRHQGFIPWDDDVDIGMLRDDYERFCAICQTKLDHERFFLQTWETDEGYRYGYSRMRREGTKYVRPGHEMAKHHNGICIDIFPMDNIPDQFILRWIYKCICLIFRKILYSPVGYLRADHLLEKNLYRVLSNIDKNKIILLFKKCINYINKKKSSRVSCVGHQIYTWRSIKKIGIDPYISLLRGIPRYLFEDLREYEFEGMLFYGPYDYDRYLKLIYGDAYMNLPPIEEQTPAHLAVEVKF